MSSARLSRGASLAALLLPAFFLAAPAAAKASDSAMAEALACRAIVADDARLACYDRAIAAVAGDPSDTAGLRSRDVDTFGRRAAAEPARNEKEFGAERLAKAAEDQVDKLESQVVEVGLTALGKIFVVLDNGQVWRQLDGDDAKARLSKEGVSTVVIRKGAMGSYLMTLDGKNRTYRVKRIK